MERTVQSDNVHLMERTVKSDNVHLMERTVKSDNVHLMERTVKSDNVHLMIGIMFIYYSGQQCWSFYCFFLVKNWLYLIAVLYKSDLRIIFRCELGFKVFKWRFTENTPTVYLKHCTLYFDPSFFFNSFNGEDWLLIYVIVSRFFYGIVLCRYCYLL